jgi:uncharacterized membrane protein
MATSFSKMRERIRESYWFIPASMGIGSVLLAAGCLAVEGEVTSSWLASSGWIYTRDATGARQLLATIGGSLITVTGVVFSVTLVALTNASSQFGTRILRTFARDTGNKVVLGAFVGTFLYCLLIMRTITGGPNGFVPHFSVLVGIALSMLCFGLLIYFIHHVIRVVQADNVITELSNDLNGTIARMFPSRIGDPAGPAPQFSAPSLHQSATPVIAEMAGYVESVDSDAILKGAVKNNITVEILCSPGAFVYCGSTLAVIRPECEPAVAQALARAFNIDSERSYVQDLGFAYQQLVLVATRSMSPAINDQLLAMTCIDRLCESLVVLGARQLPSRHRSDEDGHIRVVTPPIYYTEIVRIALSLVSEVSRDSAAVSSHILKSVGHVLEATEVPELRKALREVDRAAVSRAYERAMGYEQKAA